MPSIRIGHSPDPDDAFLFYAITQGKIDLDGITVAHVLEGIEALNQRAFSGELEMTAISLAAYPYCAGHYLLLPTGASVGEGYGPLVVSKQALALEQLQKVSVAIPGRFTTAALLLQLAAGPLQLQVIPFDQILPAVQEGRVEAGVLIHEGQLTYAAAGLKKVLDLGEWWKDQTGLPVPLGVNVIRRDLGGETIQLLANGIRDSLDYALAHRKEALAYAERFGRGLSPSLTDRFVGMYVNRFALDCRPEGARAMQLLLDRAADARLTPARVQVEFVEN